MELLDVTCPRCGGAGQQRFYGPCDSCRAELRSSVVAEAHVVDVGAYEPKMNVVPNQVATKD